MKITKIFLILNLAFIGNIFCAAAKEDALQSFLKSEDENFIPAGEAGFKKVLFLIHSPDYQKQNADGQVKNKRGRTLLCLAIIGLRVDIVRMLLDNDESTHNIEGESSALSLAIVIKKGLESQLTSNAMGIGIHSNENADLAAEKKEIADKLMKIRNIIELIKKNDELRSGTQMAINTNLNEAIPIPEIRDMIFGYLFRQKFFDKSTKDINLTDKQSLKVIDDVLKSPSYDLETIQKIFKLIADNKNNVNKEQLIKYIKFLNEAKIKFDEDIKIYGAKENREQESFGQIYQNANQGLNAVNSIISALIELNIISEKEIKKIAAGSEGCVIA